MPVSSILEISLTEITVGMDKPIQHIKCLRRQNSHIHSSDESVVLSFDSRHQSQSQRHNSPFQRLMLNGPPVRVHGIGPSSCDFDVAHSALLGGTRHLSHVL